MTRNLRVPTARKDAVMFVGGYDTESSPWTVHPGRLRESQNYEVAINNGGYVDIGGYQRFDGSTPPELNDYMFIEIDITGSFSVGDVYIQLVTGATGTILVVNDTVAPTYIVSDFPIGTLDGVNDYQVLGVTQGTPTADPLTSVAPTPKLDAIWAALVTDFKRLDVLVVPGSGPILGLFALNDAWHAFRADITQTEIMRLYVEDRSSWVEIDLGFEMQFNAGGGVTSYEVQEGDILVGQTSGATMTVKRVVHVSGTWGDGDAVGFFIGASFTGTFVTEPLEVLGVTIATGVDGPLAIQLKTSIPGTQARVQTIQADLSGADRIYGCDGVNRGFEFDGATFVPITTGVPNDTPSNVAEHKNHLFLAFNRTVQHSGIGEPLNFAPIFGAAELAMSGKITGFSSESGTESTGALVIFTRHQAKLLYGNDATDWNLVTYKADQGALSYTIQKVGDTMYLDDRGVTLLRTTLNFGNFARSSISRHIQTYIKDKTPKVIASCVVREKNQYRLFFSDNSALFITMDGPKTIGMMPVLYDHPALVVHSYERSNGVEQIMFGSDNGFVYEMDKGPSFDGGELDAYMRTHYNYSNSTGMIKRYLSVTLEAHGQAYGEFEVASEVGYETIDLSESGTTFSAEGFSASIYPELGWEQFTFDGLGLGPVTVPIEGSGENVSITIRKKNSYSNPIVITGGIYRFTTRRLIR